MVNLKPETLKLRKMLLEYHSVSNYGGIVCGLPGSKDMMDIRDLQIAIKELDSHGIKVRRVDAGGSPRWALVD